MRFPIIVAAVVVASALPAAGARTERPATAAPLPSSARAEWRVEDGAAHRVPPAHETFARTPSVATYRAALRSGLERAGFTGQFGATDHSVEVYAEPVGDLDGDGLRDVAEMVVAPGGTFLLRARRGIDGRQLWTRPLPGEGFFAPAKVGTTGEEGLVVVTDEFEETAVSGVETLTVTALDGTGAQVWQQAFRGTYASTPVSFTGAGLPIVTSQFDGLAGAAHDYVVLLLGIADSPAALGSADEVVVLDGSTGRATPAGLPDGAVDDVAFASGARDLSGDALGDLVVISPAAGSGTGRVSAYSALGAPLWVRTGISAWFAEDVGDLDGDRLTDLAAVDFGSEEGLGLVVLSGADGHTLATPAGEFGFPLGDADRDGRSDIGTVEMPFTAGAIRLTFRAFRWDGRKLYERTVSMPFSMSGGGGMISIGAGIAGDVQGDGVTDLLYEMATASLGGASASASGLVDGRTGKPVHARRTYDPVYAAVDSRGDDFARGTRTKPGVLTISAQQGSTGLPLWDTAIRNPAVAGGADVRGAPLDADRCADVLVTTSIGGNALVLALRGRDGRLLWGREVTATGERPYTAVTPGPDRNKAC